MLRKRGLPDEGAGLLPFNSTQSQIVFVPPISTGSAWADVVWKFWSWQIRPAILNRREKPPGISDFIRTGKQCGVSRNASSSNRSYRPSPESWTPPENSSNCRLSVTAIAVRSSCQEPTTSAPPNLSYPEGSTRSCTLQC